MLGYKREGGFILPCEKGKPFFGRVSWSHISVGDVKFSGRLKFSWSTNLPYSSQLID